MNSTALRTTALAAAAGGAVYVFTGAIQATHEFGGTHNTIDSTAEYLVTAGFALALFLIGPMYRVLGRMAGAGRAGNVSMAAQYVLGTLTTISVINGEDLAVFNVLAPICLLTWLASTVLVARALKRTNAVPAAVAYALPFAQIVTIVLSPIGGPMLSGAFWLVVGSRMAGLTPSRPAAQPA